MLVLGQSETVLSSSLWKQILLLLYLLPAVGTHPTGDSVQILPGAFGTLPPGTRASFVTRTDLMSVCSNNSQPAVFLVTNSTKKSNDLCNHHQTFLCSAWIFLPILESHWAVGKGAMRCLLWNCWKTLLFCSNCSEQDYQLLPPVGYIFCLLLSFGWHMPMATAVPAGAVLQTEPKQKGITQHLGSSCFLQMWKV